MSALTLAELQQLAADVGFPAADVPLAAAIAMAESGGDPNANGDPHNAPDPVNPYTSKSFGLWQIDTVYHPGTKAELTDLATNAKAALAIYRQSGGNFQQWSTAWRDAKHRQGYLEVGAPVRNYWSPSGPVPAPAIGSSVTGTLVATLAIAGITYLVVRGR